MTRAWTTTSGRRAAVWGWVGLVALLWVVAAPGVAGAHPDYRQVVDLTLPTVPGARFSDDYDVDRDVGHAHRATDLFAAAGTPVYAARGGTVTWVENHSTAGWALHVRGDDGRTYAYYHLGPAGGERRDALAAGIAEGTRVARGQRLGDVGDSGNAAGAPPHLHFEIHDERVDDPYGGHRLNPVTSLRAAQARGDYAAGGADVRLLRLGSRGAPVAAWQRELDRHAAEPVAVDGAYGPRTWQATRAFQRAEGLAVDGVVGPRTRAASAAALGAPYSLTVLRQGARGLRVAEWQQQLDLALPGAVTVDGAFGPQTDAATRQLQRRAGIGVDGLVGPTTRQAMAEALR